MAGNQPYGVHHAIVHGDTASATWRDFGMPVGSHPYARDGRRSCAHHVNVGASGNVGGCERNPTSR